MLKKSNPMMMSVVTNSFISGQTGLCLADIFKCVSLYENVCISNYILKCIHECIMHYKDDKRSKILPLFATTIFAEFILNSTLNIKIPALFEDLDLFYQELFTFSRKSNNQFLMNSRSRNPWNCRFSSTKFWLNVNRNSCTSHKANVTIH